MEKCFLSFPLWDNHCSRWLQALLGCELLVCVCSKIRPETVRALNCKTERQQKLPFWLLQLLATPIISIVWQLPFHGIFLVLNALPDLHPHGLYFPAGHLLQESISHIDATMPKNESKEKPALLTFYSCLKMQASFLFVNWSIPIFVDTSLKLSRV